MGTPRDLLGSHRYQVVAAAVVAHTGYGKESYVYRNGLLPADTDLDQIDRLLEDGMIRKIGVPR